MKLLIKAAIQSRKHLALLIFALVALLGMVIANPLEMFALGMLSEAGGAVAQSSSSNVSWNPLTSFMSEIKAHFHLQHNLKALVLVLIAVAIFKATWLFLSRYTTQLLAIRVSRDLRKRYFQHIQLLPMDFYQ